MKLVACTLSAVFSALACNASVADPYAHDIYDDFSITFSNDSTFVGEFRFTPYQDFGYGNFYYINGTFTPVVGPSALITTDQFLESGYTSTFYGFSDNGVPANVELNSAISSPVVSAELNEGGATIAATSITLTPISPTPEPGMWALFLAGFGLLGGFLRLRYPEDTPASLKQRG